VRKTNAFLGGEEYVGGGKVIRRGTHFVEVKKKSKQRPPVPIASNRERTRKILTKEEGGEVEQSLSEQKSPPPQTL